MRICWGFRQLLSCKNGWSPAITFAAATSRTALWERGSSTCVKRTASGQRSAVAKVSMMYHRQAHVRTGTSCHNVMCWHIPVRTVLPLYVLKMSAAMAASVPCSTLGVAAPGALANTGGGGPGVAFMVLQPKQAAHTRMSGWSQASAIRAASCGSLPSLGCTILQQQPPTEPSPTSCRLPTAGWAQGLGRLSPGTERGGRLTHGPPP